MTFILFNNLCTASSFTNVSRTLTSTNDLLSGDDKICLYRLTHCVPCFPSASSPRNRACDFNINVKTSGFDAEIVTQVLRSPVAKELVIEKLALTKQANDLFDTIFGLARPSNPLPYYRTIPLSTEKRRRKLNKNFSKMGYVFFTRAALLCKISQMLFTNFLGLQSA